jgi:hypothetical protein
MNYKRGAIFALMLLFVAGAVYGATTLTKDTTYVSSWKSEDGGLLYHIALPCTSVAPEDSFITWPINITRYNAVTIGYSCDKGFDSGPIPAVACTVSITWEQSFTASNADFARPFSYNCVVDSPFVDTTGVKTYKQLVPTDIDYIRFKIFPLTGHDITGDSIPGKINLYIRLSKSPIGHFKQGGILRTNQLIIPNPVYPNYYGQVYWNPTGDSLRFAVANRTGPGAKNTIGFRFLNRIDAAATVRAEGLLFPQDSLAYFSLGDWKPALVGHDAGAKTTYDTLFFYHSAQCLKGSFIDTLTVAYSESLDTIVVKNVMPIQTKHRRYPGGPWVYATGLVKQCFIWFRPSWDYSDHKMVKFVGGGNFSINSVLGDTVYCDGKEDIAFFTKYYGDAALPGSWVLLEHWNGDDD